MSGESDEMHAKVASALTALLVPIVAAVLTAGFDARAAVLFDQAQTGAQLTTNPDVSFPTVTPTVNGGSLELGPGSPSDILLRWSLLPAAARGVIHVEVTIEYEELTLDNDPRFGISDGSNWQGGSRTDQGFFTSQWAAHTATAVTTEAWASWCESLGPHLPTNSISWETHLAAGGAGPSSLTNYREGSAHCAGPSVPGGNHLDEDQAISFVIYRDTISGAEEYQIDSVHIVISDDAPEPMPMLGRSTTALLAGLLLGSCLFALRRRGALRSVSATQDQNSS